MIISAMTSIYSGFVSVEDVTRFTHLQSSVGHCHEFANYEYDYIYVGF